MAAFPRGVAALEVAVEEEERQIEDGLLEDIFDDAEQQEILLELLPKDVRRLIVKDDGSFDLSLAIELAKKRVEEV